MYRKLPSYVVEIKEHCNEHHEKFSLYCKEHECPCCGICMVETHRDCIDVAILENLIKESPSSQSGHQTSDGLDICRISHIPQKDGELDMMLISCNIVIVLTCQFT
jgi:hypothetical protein